MVDKTMKSAVRLLGVAVLLSAAGLAKDLGDYSDNKSSELKQITLQADTQDVYNVVLNEYQKSGFIVPYKHGNIRFGTNKKMLMRFYKKSRYILSYECLVERERGGMTGGYETVKKRVTFTLPQDQNFVSLDCNGGTIIPGGVNHYKKQNKYR